MIGGLGDLPLVGGVLGPLQDNASTALGQRPEDDLIARKVEGYVHRPVLHRPARLSAGSGFRFSSPDRQHPRAGTRQPGAGELHC